MTIYRLTRNRPNGDVQTFDCETRSEAQKGVYQSLVDNGYVPDRKEAARLAADAARGEQIDVDGHWYRIERVRR